MVWLFLVDDHKASEVVFSCNECKPTSAHLGVYIFIFHRNWLNPI